jgi:hypothetical protein
MPAGERRELLELDLVGVVRQALVDPREIMQRDLSGKFIGEVERGEKSISLDSLTRISEALEGRSRGRGAPG